MAADSVDPNAGSIVDSQFQPYGYALLGAQFANVSAAGESLQLTAPNNTGTPPAAPAGYVAPTAPVNTGLIENSQVNVGGFTTLGLQLQAATLGGGLRVDLLDEGIGRPAAGGTQPVPAGGAISAPQRVPPGSPGVITNTGIISSSQFNDGGFGPIGIQASGLSVAGGVSIVSRNVLGTPDVPVTPPAVPFAAAAQAMPVNTGRISDSQFADGGFGDTGLQLRTVAVGGSIGIAAERLLIQPTAGPVNVGPPSLVGRLNVKTRVVTFARGPAGSAPPTSMLYPGMLVTGRGIPAKTTILSIGVQNRITLSKLPLKTGAVALTFFAPVTATNTGSIVSSQVADGGFGDIGMQWSHVTIGGSVATLHSGLQIQPELANVGAITTGQKQFGLAIQPTAAAAPSDPPPAVAPAGATGTPSSGANGGTNSGTNSATNSGRIVASQFADGGFGDIGMQWQNVTVSGNVEATHNALSVQPENDNQGVISVAQVSFAASPPPVAPAAAGPAGPLPSAPRITTPGTPVSPSPAPSPAPPTGYQTNAATNSNLVSQSQFTDGGFGDIGMQWSNVTIRGDVQVVHNSLSIKPTGSGLAGVSVRDVTFGSAGSTAGDPRLRPVTLAAATVSSSGPAGTPPFVPNNAYARKSNATNLNGRQFLSQPAAATSRQWRSMTLTPTGLVIVNNVLTVSNTGAAGSKPGATAGAITLSGIRFPGNAPALPPAVRAVPVAAGLRAAAATTAAARQVNAASNSGVLLRNQFLDGGTGDIGLQWRDVTVDGSVRIEHNTCSINVVSDASDTGPILVSGIRFDSGWAATGAHSDMLLLTPAAAGAARANLQAAASTTAASNSGRLTGGQFLDGGMGQIGLQWQQVTVHCPIRIVNNVLSVTVSGTNTQRVTVQDVTFV